MFFNQGCDYFVDAQLHHAWNAGSMPVVMATDKLDEFLPGPYLNHSVIKVRDFETPQLLSLAEYLKYLSNNDTEYNKYLEWTWGHHWNRYMRLLAAKVSNLLQSLCCACRRTNT